MPGAIIADTSCLILLEKINELQLLKSLFGRVIITSEIEKEFGHQLPEWFDVKNPSDNKLQILLETTLDKGESSAIALAKELSERLLILDDKKARNIASELKLNFTGTYGIIVAAKRSGFISSVNDILIKIRKTNFRISLQTEKMILRIAGE